MTKEQFIRISNKLASDQRGAPESAMLRIQHSQIAQLYGYIAEHTGDITHRMAEFPEIPWTKGNYSTVREKVDKVLRYLRDPYGFEREFREQIPHNVPYLKDKNGALKYKSEAEALARLRELGQVYADEHKKLVTANEAQCTARDAAVAIGEFRFDDAVCLLEKLEAVLDKGPEVWTAYALEKSGKQTKPKNYRVRTIRRSSKAAPSELGGIR